MKKYKPQFKLIIGIAALAFFAVVMFFVFRPDNLENKYMKHWGNISIDRKLHTVKKLVETDKDSEKMVECLDKHSKLTEFENMKVKEVISLCFISIKLKDYI